MTRWRWRCSVYRTCPTNPSRSAGPRKTPGGACAWEARVFDFKPKSHVELCESLKLVDSHGGEVVGSGFNLYTNGERDWSGH